MARNDHSEAPGAADPPAQGLADDVRKLLDQLAGQINDADQRHAESRQDMQARAASLADRATAAKPDVPEDCADAFGRVETAMANLAGRLGSPNLGAPSSSAPDADTSASVLPEEVRADLRRAVAEGNRELPAAPPLRARSSATAEVPADTPGRDASAGPEAAAKPAGERTWLEDRFAAIADRVEQSLSRFETHDSFEALGPRFDKIEQHFAAVLDRLPARDGLGADSLHAVEKQITALSSHLDKTQTQLGRLDTIEQRLADLRQGPSDAQLSALAMAAAERVAESLRATTQPSGAASPGGESGITAADPRLGELTALLQAFVAEQRSVDALNGEALDTLHQAMQHLIDRVEAIEATQSTGHEALMRAVQAMPARPADNRHESLDFGFREQDLTPAGGIAGMQELPRLAVIGPPAAPPRRGQAGEPVHGAPEPDLDDSHRRLAAAFDELTEAPDSAPAAQPAPPPGAPAAAGPSHRQAFIAMARRAAEKAASEPAPKAEPSAVKPAGPLSWVRRLAGNRAADEDAGPSQRSRILLVASFVAFLLAGYWMLAGTGLRGLIPGMGSEPPAQSPGTSNAAPSGKPSSRSASDPAEKTARFLPSGPMPGVTDRFPGVGRLADGGIGVTIQERDGPSSPNAAPRQDQPQPAAVLTTEPAARGSDAPPGPVEMPPAMIGPLSLRHAAANGEPAAQFEVASRFAEAKGVPQDFAQAATWYQRAAAQGHAQAQYRLGALYERGLGVAADPVRARVWYGRAAEQGNVRAMHNLAVFSAGRPGATEDYPRAVQWFTEAANRGLADSQYNLGILYESGRGVPASLVEAYKWYALAARSGDKDAATRRDALRARLDPASVSAADTLIIRWRAKPLDPAANDVRAMSQAARQ